MYRRIFGLLLFIQLGSIFARNIHFFHISTKCYEYSTVLGGVVCIMDDSRPLNRGLDPKIFFQNTLANLIFQTGYKYSRTRSVGCI